MDAAKTARMAAALDSIQQRWGNRALQTARQALSSTPALPPLLTGFPTLDRLLPAGLPRGHTSELLGAPTSGMLTLAYHLIASAQRLAADAILIDLEETFDPDYAARCDISLERLFLVRPDTSVEALDIAYDLLLSGGVSVLALDVGRTPPASHLLRRFTPVLAQSGAVVLLLRWLDDAPPPDMLGSGPGRGVRLYVQRQAWLRRGQDITGCRSRVQVIKGQLTGSVTLELSFEGHNAREIG